MQRTEPIERTLSATRPGTDARAGTGSARGIIPRVVLGAMLVVLGGYGAAGLCDADRFVGRSAEGALASLAVARSAPPMLAQMRADHGRLFETADRAERARLDERIARLRLSLINDLGSIGGRALSVRTSQAAVAAQEAVLAWYEAAQGRGGSAEDSDDLDRLAAVTDVQLVQLARFAARDALASRTNAEAAIAFEVRTMAGILGGTLVLLALLAASLLRRSATARNPGATGADRAPGEAVEAKAESAQPGSVPLLPATDPADAPDAACASAGDPGRGPAEAFGACRAGLVAVDADERTVAADAEAATLVAGCAPTHRDGRTAAAGPSVQIALDTMSQGLCLYDASHILLLVNRRYEEIYRLAPGTVRPGMSATEVLERSLTAGNHPGKTLPELLRDADHVLANCREDDHFQEIEGGRVLQICVRPTVEGGFVATYEDVTERWHAEARIAYMARHDALTDLPNRLLLAERIEGAVTQASRERGFAVHALDLDHFKQVNDTLGHAVGDELLRAVSHRLRACLRETDTVARLGGDEFAIVQGDIERPEDAAVLARHIVDVLSAPYELTDHAVTVGVSIGIALAPADGMAPDRLLKNADVALYRAKGDGRGVFRFFEPEMDARLQARRLLEIDLRAAIAAEAFDLHYQPIYDLAQDRICGFEALLRWTHPTRGRVSPAEFIPLAEEIGLIVPLGDWVLRRACAQAARWPGDLKIAVNVSPAQFRSAQLIRTVREALDETGLAAHRLELEITETVLMANRGATVAILHALRGLGARISMDDFGTGYSSLSYLRSFPFDKMKIDQSFIRDLTVENGSGFIVKAVISLGSNLGMTLTAEGVETEAQLARLRAEGCDEVQGYLFSPPVPSAQIPALLEKWNGKAFAPLAADRGALAAA